jgi:hypothetical protein
MASCATLLPLCSVPKLATRDGMTGASSYVNLIGIGFWSPSGSTLSFPDASIPQDNSRTYAGTAKPNTFSKGYSANVPGTCA